MTHESLQMCPVLFLLVCMVTMFHLDDPVNCIIVTLAYVINQTGL